MDSQVPALPWMCWEALSKFLSISGSQFVICKMEIMMPPFHKVTGRMTGGDGEQLVS